MPHGRSLALEQQNRPGGEPAESADGDPGFVVRRCETC
jgi:hypothetical protein